MKKQLSKSDVQELNATILSQFNISDFFSKKDRVALVEESNLKGVLRENVLVFFYKDGRIVPSLRLLLVQPILKKVVVDMGAVKFMSSGADVMRPGIVFADVSIKKDEFVMVVDQTHQKPLCVARALFLGEELMAMSQGKVLKNIHWVGDIIWQFVP